MNKTSSSQLKAIKKYKKKSTKQLNFELYEKDFDLLENFKKIPGKFKNDKLRLLIESYLNRDASPDN
ncbi:hypothetical protein [Francisella hispaniensis]|uniref:Uncharacterized protein n=1 Tax=Francisella hispaniensis TaxID=622488 RepID=F4BFQ5_9GAMM|nr:hypothetical protein [Francisella hispaniensis]AEE26299.1 hypothetical protein FN3523_0996 [Francisella hispaniensis]